MRHMCAESNFDEYVVAEYSSKKAALDALKEQYEVDYNCFENTSCINVTNGDLFYRIEQGDDSYGCYIAIV